MSFLKYLLLIPISIIAFTSCTSLGCTDETATNFDSSADEDNGECVYIVGCIDEKALNFDTEATKDDRSCKYDTTGSVAFWTNGEINGSSISIAITKETTSSITGDANFSKTITLAKEMEAAPACSKTESYVFTGGAGTYKYEATTGFNSPYRWEGEVTVRVGDCNTKKLEKFPEIKVSGNLKSNQGGTDANYFKVINNCDFTYDITFSTGTAQHAEVRANASTMSPKLWDADNWEVRVNKKSGSLGVGGCAGYKAKLENISLKNGALYEIIIGQ